MTKIRITEVAYHRNGIAGEGFHVVTFTAIEDRIPRNMIGILFDKQGQCAVLNIAETAAGNIAFAMGNSWRGDQYEPTLRQAVAEYQREDCLLTS